MSNQMNAAITDEMLVAYIDRQIPDVEASVIERAIAESPDLQRRVSILESGSRPFADAFASLLGQHSSGLQQDVEHMLSSQYPPKSNLANRWGVDRRAVMASGAIAGVMGVVGYWIGRSSAPDMDNWREAVAQYHKLYSDQTLEQVADAPAVTDEALARTAHVLGLPLSRAMLETPGLTYKRAQILQFEDKPLAQIAYVSQRGKPLAFCIRRMKADAALPQAESRAGLSVVHWLQGGFGFMVVADMGPQELQRIAATFSDRIRSVQAG